MPIYEYWCIKCSRRFEEIKKFSESEDKAKCESCGDDVPRAISTPSRAQFKGSGFYETDYKRKGR